MEIVSWIVGGLVVSVFVGLAAAQVLHFNDQKPRRPDHAPGTMGGGGRTP